MNAPSDLRYAVHELLGIHLSPQQIESFDWYARELIDWNKRFNLTAITDAQGIEVKHFLDSLTCMLVMGPRATGSMVDVGTGAGFPSLPIKIVNPRLNVTLVESVGKKTSFCRHVVRRLGLKGVDVLHARAEQIGKLEAYREKFDWGVARAVAGLSSLAEYLLPLLRVGGWAIMQKGETGPAEVHQAEEALRMLGGRFDQMIPLELPRIVETRYLIAIEKVAATPPKYPRRAGMPTKRPL